MEFPTRDELVNDMAEMLDVPVESGVDLDVRLQVLDDGTWNLHYGDAQYDIDHHGYWGASAITVGMRRKELADIADDLISQAEDHHAQVDE